MHAYEEGAKTGQVWERSKRKHRPGRAAVCPWFKAPLVENACAPSWVCISVLLQSCCFFVCSPTCCAESLIINLAPVFASLKHSCYNGSDSQGSVAYFASGGVAARIPGSILGQVLKTTHCCLRSASHSLIRYDPGSSLHHPLLNYLFVFFKKWGIHPAACEILVP